MEGLERLRDKKDKLVSRLYQHKLDALLQLECNTLHKCAQTLTLPNPNPNPNLCDALHRCSHCIKILTLALALTRPHPPGQVLLLPQAIHRRAARVGALPQGER